MSTQILVVAELHDGHVRKSTHSAITFARSTKLPFSLAKDAAEDVKSILVVKVA